MNNSPKKSVLALVAATGAILFLGTSSAQASPAPAGRPASNTHTVQASPAAVPGLGQLGRSRILWCL